MKFIISAVLAVVYTFFMYLFIFGILIFKHPLFIDSDLSYTIDDMLVPSVNAQHAMLVEEPLFALDVRLALIEKATQSIDISTYSIHDDESRDIIFGALVIAANRGVKVRLIVDGFIEGRGYNDSEVINHLASHPNIDVAYYEVFSIFKPYAVQNRLHDKFFIIDSMYGLIGGRNIGDRYFFPSDIPTKDRDVLIYGNPSKAVNDMQSYYEELFNSPFTIHLDIINGNPNKFTENYQNYLSTYLPSLDVLLDPLYDETSKVDNVTFLHSPLTRLYKQPVIMSLLIDLAEDYDEIIIQSPYIIFSREFFKLFNPPYDQDIIMITNHPYINPNLLATSGYIKYREFLTEHVELYENQARTSLHMKTIVYGDNVSVIGSLNFDPRSAFLSTESAVIIYDQAFTQKLKTEIDHYLSNSLLVLDDLSYEEGQVEAISYSRQRRMLVHVVAWFTNLFDEML